MKQLSFRVTAMTLIALTALTLLMTLAGRAVPYHSVSYFKEDQGIGLIDVQRGLATWAVADPTVTHVGQWSPDGRMLAYTAEGDDTGQTDIFVMDVDAGVVRNLSRSPQDDTNPRWSPDGRMLAYMTDDMQGTDYLGRRQIIHVADAASGMPLEHLSQTNGLNLLQSWSPDSRILTYISQEPGQSSYSTQLRFLDVTTGELLPHLTQRDGRYYSLVWSPDGRWFTFNKQEVESTTIYLGERETGRVRLIPQFAIGLPMWSPDSQKIAFTVLSYSQGNARQALFILEVNSMETMMLTQHAGSDSYPAWSPDSRQLVVESDRDGRRKLYLLDIDSGQAQLLNDHPYFASDLSWSPDGRMLVFNSSDTRRVEVYVMDMADFSVRQITHDGENYSPGWRPP